MSGIDMHEFYAGLANMDKPPTPWCTMGCKRRCVYSIMCEMIKGNYRHDVELVRLAAEATLREMRE